MERRWMERALELAKEAADDGEVPVGAVVIRRNSHCEAHRLPFPRELSPKATEGSGLRQSQPTVEIVGEGRNRREKGKNALYHAELEAINAACKKLGGWRLWECELYVTLEPCPMCAGAIVNARIPQIYFGAYDPKNGCCGSVADILNLPLAFRPKYEGGIMESECSQILSDFFKTIR